MPTPARPLRIGFYAPLKSPDHPVPSGDRKMARQLVGALRDAGHEVAILSQMRAYLPDPEDHALWQRLGHEAAAEVVRVEAQWRDQAPDLLFCYHPYYKSPDLIALPLSQRLGLAYVTCEASLSQRRNIGVWAESQARAQDAVTAAAVNLCLTSRDAAGLAQMVPGARVARFAPFIDTSPFTAPPRPEPGHVVAVAMMRPGDKLESFRHLALTLGHLPASCDWRLSIAGDGPAAVEVRALFSGLPPGRVDWLGALSPDQIVRLLSRGAVYLWPGIGEAYGLAYLEAQAAGLPVVAYRTAGVPEVVSATAGAELLPMGDHAGLAAAVAALIADPSEAKRRGLLARKRVLRHHSLAAATERLEEVVRAVMHGRGM